MPAHAVLLQALLTRFNLRHFMDMAAAKKAHAEAEAIFEKERSPPTAPFGGAGGHSLSLNSLRSRRSTRQLRRFPRLLQVEDCYSCLHRRFSWLLGCPMTCRSAFSLYLWLVRSPRTPFPLPLKGVVSNWQFTVHLAH